ncbi:hypothetical protein FWC31_03340 [Candidatus Saccharibacteria bacterium]|nr:hypothetical protein [Candidatus Saccharibacteria bacterium]
MYGKTPNKKTTSSQDPNQNFSHNNHVLTPPSASEMLSHPKLEPEKPTNESPKYDYIDPLDVPQPKPTTVISTENTPLPKDTNKGISDPIPIQILGIEIKHDLPTSVYTMITIGAVLIVLLITSVGYGISVLNIIFSLLFAITITTALKMFMKTKFRNGSLGYYVMILVIAVVAFSVTGYFSGQQRYISSLQHQFGCSIDKYANGFNANENLRQDVKYVECMAEQIIREAVGNDDISAACNLDDGTGTIQSAIFSQPHGYVYIGKRKSSLSHIVCDSLYSWLKTDRRKLSDAQGWAFEVILYEAMYLKGARNEAEATYKSMLTYKNVVTGFGVKSSEADRFIEYFKNDINPRQPAQYRVDWKARGL